MGHTYTNLNYHLAFSTKDRLPLITKAAQPRVYAYIGGIVREVKGEMLASAVSTTMYTSFAAWVRPCRWPMH